VEEEEEVLFAFNLTQFIQTKKRVLPSKKPKDYLKFLRRRDKSLLNLHSYGDSVKDDILFS